MIVVYKINIIFGASILSLVVFNKYSINNKGAKIIHQILCTYVLLCCLKFYLIFYISYIYHIFVYISQPIIVLHSTYFIPFDLNLIIKCLIEKINRPDLCPPYLWQCVVKLSTSRVQELKRTRVINTQSDFETNDDNPTAADVVFLSRTPTITRWTETDVHAVPIHKSSFTTRWVHVLSRFRDRKILYP